MTLYFNSKNQNIQIFKGNTGSITIRQKDEAVYSDGDSVTFTAFDKQGSVVFSRLVTEFVNENKDAIITFLAEHTAVSDIYKYSIVYNTVGGQIMNIIPNICDGTRPTFTICEG